MLASRKLCMGIEKPCLVKLLVSVLRDFFKNVWPEKSEKNFVLFCATNGKKKENFAELNA